MTPAEIEHWVRRLDDLNRFLHSYPLPTELRERMTFREFHAIVDAKELELGLSPEIMKELVAMRDDPAVSWAFTEIGMTYDNRELAPPSYYWDFPLNFYWMDEYEPVMKAVGDRISSQGKYVGTSDDELAEVVRQFLIDNPLPAKA